MKSTPSNPVGHPRRASGWPHLVHGAAKALAAVTAILLAATFSGCEGPETYNPIPPDAYSPPPSGTLAAGDVLRVSYPGAPEMNTVQQIQANGKVNLPTIGDVTAQGKSAATLQSQLTGLYQGRLQNPTVLVSVEAASSSVYVSGEVMKPGKVPLDRSMTLLEAIGEAGGFTKLANPKEVVVVRTRAGKSERYALNLSNTGAGDAAFYVRPYDTIHVKERRW